MVMIHVTITQYPELVVSFPDPLLSRYYRACARKTGEEGLVQLVQNNSYSTEFQRAKSDWLID